MHAHRGKVRTLTVLFRRDPSRDRQINNIRREGYQLLWPDGQPVGVGVDALCNYGQRLFALGRYLTGQDEKLMELNCFPLTDREDKLTRIPGHRVRRFMLKREGMQGRIHFLDGTPTEVFFQFGRDEAVVLHWIGLTGLRDGEHQWFDLAARPVGPVRNGHPTTLSTNGHSHVPPTPLPSAS